MIYSTRRCPPTWTIKDGYFQPVLYQFCDAEEDTVLGQVLSALKSIQIPDSMSLYVRGGVVEERNPHPQADIDLLLIGESTTTIVEEITAVLKPLQRPIEPVALHLRELQRLYPIMMMIQYRSLLVYGSSIDLPKIPIDSKIIESLWRLYHPIFCMETLQGSVMSRLRSVKYLIRSVGVLGLFQGRYSRDLRTCIEWSKELVPDAYLDLQKAFDNLSHEDVEPQNIRQTRLLIQEAHQRFKKF